MPIQTHTTLIRQQTQPNQPHFNLNELFPTSTNVEVKRYPLRVIAWGLTGAETVTVHIARVQSLGNRHWTLSDDCCPCVIEPSALANVENMPYKKCKQAVVLTADEPAIHIDDAGTYYFEYHGTNSVIIDHYDDPIIPKNRLCDCDL
ncbi:hypothetical protein [Lonepinella sp. BR2357]|uniref:hypothetical protein n=1 Tax=Lonepinella sp. BR2357 TaxID=3434549 RepID=UPI003F6DC32B